MTRTAEDELDGLRRAVAARSLGIEADVGLTDALLQRYRRALERRVADALRRRYPCSAAMIGHRCFLALVQRLVIERRDVVTFRQAEQIVAGGWFGQQQALQALPWLGELIRLESMLADRMLADMTVAPLARRRSLLQVLHFHSDWDVVRIYDWWRSGARGAAPSPGHRVAVLIVGRSGHLRIIRLPCVPSARPWANHTPLATTPPGG